MRIAYVTNVRIPNARAHSEQVMMTCDAFAQEGADVTLVAPRYRGVSEKEAFEALALPKRFAITYLPALMLPPRVPGAFVLMTLTFAFSARWYLRRHANDIVYSRGDMALFLSWRRLVWESHIRPKSMRLYGRLFKKALITVVVTDTYRKELIERDGVPAERICLAPDGVSPERFENSAVANPLASTRGKVTVLYAGSNVAWKGVDTLREAAKLLPENYQVVLLGRHAPGERLLTPGIVPAKDIPAWLSCADVLVSTAAAGSDIAEKYTSPLKVFEYLAAGKPIVAADTASHREILDESVAHFYEPGSAESLARAVKMAAASSFDTAHAKALAEKYSWRSRAQTILEAIERARATIRA